MNKYVKTLKREDYDLFSVAIRNLMHEDDEPRNKIGYNIISQYVSQDEEGKNLIDRLLKSLVNKDFKYIVWICIEGYDEEGLSVSFNPTDFSEVMDSEGICECIYWFISEKMDDTSDGSRAVELLTILSEVENTPKFKKVAEMFLINLCGYSPNTIISYMEGQDVSMVVDIPRFDDFKKS